MLIMTPNVLKFRIGRTTNKQAFTEPETYNRFSVRWELVDGIQRVHERTPQNLKLHYALYQTSQRPAENRQ